MVMMAINAFLPLYVQGAMARSPAAAGLVLGAASVSWTFASVAAGRLMIRTSYRLAATVGGIALIAGTLVLMSLGPTSSLLRAGLGSLLIGIGMGFCNTSFLVSTRRERAGMSAAWRHRRSCSCASSAIRSGGGVRRDPQLWHSPPHPDAGDAVNRLLEPAARHDLGAAEIARLSEAVAGSLHVVYVVAGLVAVVGLILALALPARLSPTRPHRQK